MIIYACLARCLDSMPLSATDALSKGSENLLQESKRAVKLLSKQVSKFPPKLCIQEDNYTIHCVKDETTCFFVVCDPTYPHILAYSFLDELMKEFSLLYTPSVVNAVKRPFGFIEFDSYLHKVQQKYNSPRTLASRLNIPDLTNDINLNPPVYKKLSDYEGNNFKNLDRPSPPHSTIVISNGSLPNGILKNHIESDVLVQMRPIPWYGRIALILVIPCMLLDAYRGIVSLHAPSLEGSDETAVVHGCSFLFEMIFLAIQVCRYPEDLARYPQSPRHNVTKRQHHRAQMYPILDRPGNGPDGAAPPRREARELVGLDSHIDSELFAAHPTEVGAVVSHALTGYPRRDHI